MGISSRRIQVLCSKRRITGATKMDCYWAIPTESEKSKDARIKTGKYVNTKEMEQK